MKNKLLLFPAILVGLSFCTCGQNIQADTTTTSTVTARVFTGELTMTPPKSLSKNVTLTGSDSSFKLPVITTHVADNRGVASGWEISVKTDNYDSFKQYIDLYLKSDSHEISVNQTYQILTQSGKQVVSEDECYSPTVRLSHATVSNDYTIQLSWSLSPTESISE